MISPDPSTWSKLSYRELEAEAERIAAMPSLPTDVREAVAYWRAEMLGVQRSARRVLELATALGVRR